jgi:hypothetical protein
MKRIPMEEVTEGGEAKTAMDVVVQVVAVALATVREVGEEA